MYAFHFICYSCHIIPVRYDLFAIGLGRHCTSHKQFNNNYKQDAQLSQRDRAAGCVIVFAK